MTFSIEKSQKNAFQLTFEQITRGKETESRCHVLNSFRAYFKWIICLTVTFCFVRCNGAKRNSCFALHLRALSVNMVGGEI